jgi:putative Mg2+ transporter-C (MgtC) family protein
MLTLSALEITERIAAAVGLGALVGIERELRDKSAGVLTHAMLSLGACAFALVSVDAFGKGSDPSRLAAQIVSGVGFLGAGTIIRSGGTVRGLTTAASLWVTAAVGTACGVGYLGPGAGVALAAVLSLVILRNLKTRLRKRFGQEVMLSVSTSGLEGDISSVLKLLGDSPVRVAHVDIGRDEDGDGRLFAITVDRSQEAEIRTLMQSLTLLHGVERVEMDDA